jgi:hypothetical protein
MMNNLVDLQMMQDKRSEIEIPSNGTSRLQAVYRNPSIPLPVRLRAAIAALPHEVRRLSLVAQVNEQDFATLLDQRIKRMEQMERIEAVPQTIEAKPPPLPRLADRRFRRV